MVLKHFSKNSILINCNLRCLQLVLGLTIFTSAPLNLALELDSAATLPAAQEPATVLALLRYVEATVMPTGRVVGRRITYYCPECARSFPAPSRLDRHVRTHTGEKPFKCGNCPKAFAQEYNLVVHQRGHSGERPHVCDQCDKAFRTLGHLVTHGYMHTGARPYACTDCDATFRQSSHLARHKLVHSGMLPHACLTCPKGFKTKRELTLHTTRRHTGEKPYSAASASEIRPAGSKRKVTVIFDDGDDSR